MSFVTSDKRISVRLRKQSPAAESGRGRTPATGSRRRANRGPSEPRAVKTAEQGLSISVTMSLTAIRYATWLLTILVLLAVCWCAPDAAVLAAKLKALCEAVKLLK